MTWVIRSGHGYVADSSRTKKPKDHKHFGYGFMDVYFTSNPEEAKKFRTEASAQELIDRLEKQSTDVGSPSQTEMLGMVTNRFKDALVRKIMKS